VVQLGRECQSPSIGQSNSKGSEVTLEEKKEKPQVGKVVGKEKRRISRKSAKSKAMIGEKTDDDDRN
jgi:hypothetical protein